jgi:hypothetical protein
MILGAENIQRLRRAETIGPDGRAVKSVLSTATIRGSVQPLTDRQREVLPEGIRQSVTRKVYTKSDLRTADQLTNTPSDLIVYGGETYEVVRVTRWPALLSHFEADLVRVTEPDDQSGSGLQAMLQAGLG